MNDVFSSETPFFGWLWRASWQAAVLIGLVLLAQALFRRQLAPAWRYRLWLLVLLRLLLPVLPPSGLSVFNFIRWPSAGSPAASALLATPSPRALDAPQSEANAPSVPPPVESGGSLGQIVLAPGKPTLAGLPTPPAPPHGGPGSSVLLWLELLWAAGVLLQVARLTWQNARFAMRLKRQSSAMDPALETVLDQCRQELGVRRQVRLVQTDLVCSPAVYGLFRPELLLPVGLAASFSPRELRFVLLHELAHVKRRDMAVNWLVLGLQVLHWFNPIIRFGLGRLRADRELACDALVLSRSNAGDGTCYGRTIIKLLESFTPPARSPGLVGILEDKRQIARRIRMIAAFKQPSRWSACAALLVGGLALASLTDAETRVNPGPRPQTSNLDHAAPPASTQPAPLPITPQPNPRDNGTPSVPSPVATPAANPTDLVVPAAPPTAPDPVQPAGGGGINSSSSLSVTRTPDPAQPAPVGGATEPTLHTRTFRLNADTVEDALDHILIASGKTGPFAAPHGTNVAEKLRSYLIAVGVDLPGAGAEAATSAGTPGRGSRVALFYKDRAGLLMVRATLAELDSIENALQLLNSQAELVTIEARLVELDARDARALGFDWFLGQTLVTNDPTAAKPLASANVEPRSAPPSLTPVPVPPPQPALTADDPFGIEAETAAARAATGGVATITGLLTEPQFRTVLGTLDRRSSVTSVVSPKTTTLSGREMNLVLGERGYTLNLVPSVAADGVTVTLRVEFALASPAGRAAPAIRLSTASAVLDGQTLVLTSVPAPPRVVIVKDKVPLLGDLPLIGRLFRSERVGSPRPGQTTTVVLFITPTIIDPAGNRVHAADRSHEGARRSPATIGR